MDGLYGSIIVHPQGKVPSKPSPSIVASDFISTATHGASAAGKVSSSWYVNGGSNEMNNAYATRWYFSDSVEATAARLDGIKLNGRQSNRNTSVPTELIDLTSHQNRLHLVCASADYGIEFEIKAKTVQLILHELDGYPTNPIKTERLYLQPGETAVVEVIALLDTVELVARAGGYHKNSSNIGGEQHEQTLALAQTRGVLFLLF